jgi:hypothetical protein
MYENLQIETNEVKKEKDRVEVEAKKEIHDLRENLRKLSNANEELKNDKKALQRLLEARDKAEKQSYSEATKSGTSRFNPDGWIPQYQSKTIHIHSDSDSTECESEVEWTDVESKRSKRKKKANSGQS